MIVIFFFGGEGNVNILAEIREITKENRDSK